jgi:hypothetical protein
MELARATALIQPLACGRVGAGYDHEITARFRRSMNLGGPIMGVDTLLVVQMAALLR